MPKGIRTNRALCSKSSSFETQPWYAEKAKVRAYLEEINKEKKVGSIMCTRCDIHQILLITSPQILEYTLFQPGFLTDYFAPPGATSKHLHSVELWIDFQNRRAIILDGIDSVFTLTTMNDLANVVARAIEYGGEWPVIGGINGTTLSTSKFLEIGAKVRGTENTLFAYQEETMRELINKCKI